MDFKLGNMPIHNARNIEWKDNGDGTGQLWFNTVFVDADNQPHDMRIHIFRLKIDGLISMEYEDGKLWECIEVDDKF